MDKQEVVEALDSIVVDYNSPERMLEEQMTKVVQIVKRLDEPKKVKVPQLPSKIAKYLEWAKEEQFDFTEDYNMISWENLRTFGGDDTEYLQMWFFDNDQKENERRHILFLQAYTDRYEVEEEPLFYIRLTIPSSSVVGLYLGFNKDGIFDH